MMKTYSADGQDLFVQEVMKGKRQGTFVDIGAAMPIQNNNTYLFQSEYDWSGLLIENDVNYVMQLMSRCPKASVLQFDATTLDYEWAFKKWNMPKVIDYLSLDIDPPDATLEVLKRLPLDEYSFRCVTFEHDRYWYGDSVAEESREIFKKNGYTLYKKDAECPLGPYEDWYIK